MRKTERKSKNGLEKEREIKSEWYKEGDRMVLRKTDRRSKNFLVKDRKKEQEVLGKDREKDLECS